MFFSVLRVIDAEATKHCDEMSSGDKPCSDRDNFENVDDDDLPKSCSSTVAGEISRPCMVPVYTSN